MLLFQANIRKSHWFFVSVNFKEKSICVHDSSSVVTHKHCIPLKSRRILDYMAGRKAKDYDQGELKSICNDLGMSNSGSRGMLVRRLLRPMCAQELYHFVESEWNRNIHANSMSGWSLALSNEMPQQPADSVDCGLFVSIGCDLLSTGGSLSAIDAEKLERIGRPSMAHLAKVCDAS